jgi:hypothetical protein
LTLPGNEVFTVHQRSWSRFNNVNNGELLRVAEAAGFEVLITADKNIRHQQNLVGRRIAIIVLPTNTLQLLLPMFPAINGALNRTQPGGYEELPP